MEDSFSSYHPILNFIFFAVVLGVTMFVTHPAVLTISLISAATYNCIIRGIKPMLKSLFGIAIPMGALAIIVNPLVNHYGVTTLGYMKNGNPITLETIVYGFIMALMLSAVIMWFSCYNEVMTTDKFIYIFGRIIPGLSLVLSMALRFVPRFLKQAKNIDRARRGIGENPSSGNFIKRIKCAITNCSILITWALENSIDTADSMKARGYGSRKRTAYSLFYFEKKDLVFTCSMLIFGGIFFAGVLSGSAKVSYNPIISIPDMTFKNLLCYMAFTIFGMLPSILYLASAYRYKKIQKNVGNNLQKEWRLWEL